MKETGGMHMSRQDERLVPLTGGFNLRDFGGHVTQDGRQVKRGHLYRSGSMSFLTPEDVVHLRSLGIRTICDFRRPDERRAQPTSWHEETDTVYWSRDYTEQSGILGSLIRDGSVDAAQLRDTMIAIYAKLLDDHEASYRAMFDALAQGQSPLLINCAAGKDRTGVGAALVLLALGVSREDVVADYLLTNELCDWDWRFALENSSMARHYLADPERLRPILSADTDYLDTVFGALDTQHGGPQAYMANRLGLNPGKLARIRATLTQEPT